MAHNQHKPTLVPTEIALDELTLEEAQVGENKIEVTNAQPIEWVEFPDAKSLRAHIFSTPDIKEEIIDIPEWRCQLLVRGLNAKTRAKIIQGALTKDGKPDLEKMYPDLVRATARHPVTKELVFPDAGDIAALNEKSGGVMERLAMKAAQLSGLDTESQAQTEQNFQGR